MRITLCVTLSITLCITSCSFDTTLSAQWCTTKYPLPVYGSSRGRVAFTMLETLVGDARACFVFRIRRNDSTKHWRLVPGKFHRTVSFTMIRKNIYIRTNSLTSHQQSGNILQYVGIQYCGVKYYYVQQVRLYSRLHSYVLLHKIRIM